MSKFSTKLRNAASVLLATEGSEVSSPKAKIDTSTLTPKQRGYIVTLLDTKLLPEGQKINGLSFTFGELNKAEARPNGAKGRHFPVVSGLSASEAGKAIDALKALPENPNAKRSYQPKAASTDSNSANAEVAELKAQMAELIALVGGEAAPTATPGHQMVSNGEAVEVEATEDGEAVEAIEVAEGDFLLIDGELYQVGRTPSGRINVKLA